MDIIVKTILKDEKFLRQKSQEVNLNCRDYLNDVVKLDEYCHLNKDLFALAAIQIGIPRRIIYVRNTHLEDVDEGYNERKIFINPIIMQQVGLTKFWEACASCLDKTGLVRRPYRIKIGYYDLDAEWHEEFFEGFAATVLSHEYDHLNGVLHYDIADEVLEMTQEERKLFRKEHHYEVIRTDGEYKLR